MLCQSWIIVFRPTETVCLYRQRQSITITRPCLPSLVSSSQYFPQNQVSGIRYQISGIGIRYRVLESGIGIPVGTLGIPWKAQQAIFMFSPGPLITHLEPTATFNVHGSRKSLADTEARNNPSPLTGRPQSPTGRKTAWWAFRWISGIRYQVSGIRYHISGIGIRYRVLESGFWNPCWSWNPRKSLTCCYSAC